MNDKRPFCRRWGTAVSAVGVEGIAWAHRAFENKPAAYRHSPKPVDTFFVVYGVFNRRKNPLIASVCVNFSKRVQGDSRTLSIDHRAQLLGR